MVSAGNHGHIPREELIHDKPITTSLIDTQSRHKQLIVEFFPAELGWLQIGTPNELDFARK